MSGQLHQMLFSYGEQRSDCISRLRDIPAEDDRAPNKPPRDPMVPLSAYSGQRNHDFGPMPPLPILWFFCPLYPDKGTTTLPPVPRCLPERVEGGGRCSSGGMFGDMQSDLGRGGAALHVLLGAQRRGGQFRRRSTGPLPPTTKKRGDPGAAPLALPGGGSV